MNGRVYSAARMRPACAAAPASWLAHHRLVLGGLGQQEAFQIALVRQ